MVKSASLPLSGVFGALVGGRDLRRLPRRFRRSGRLPNVLYVRASLLPAERIYGRLSRRFRRAGDYLVWADYLTGYTGELPNVQNVQNVQNVRSKFF